MKKTTNSNLYLAYDNETNVFIRGMTHSIQKALSAVMKECEDFHSLVKNAL